MRALGNWYRSLGLHLTEPITGRVVAKRSYDRYWKLMAYYSGGEETYLTSIDEGDMDNHLKVLEKIGARLGTFKFAWARRYQRTTPSSRRGVPRGKGKRPRENRGKGFLILNGVGVGERYGDLWARYSRRKDSYQLCICNNHAVRCVKYLRKAHAEYLKAYMDLAQREIHLGRMTYSDMEKSIQSFINLNYRVKISFTPPSSQTSIEDWGIGQERIDRAEDGTLMETVREALEYSDVEGARDVLGDSLAEAVEALDPQTKEDWKLLEDLYGKDAVEGEREYRRKFSYAWEEEEEDNYG